MDRLQVILGLPFFVKWLFEGLELIEELEVLCEVSDYVGIAI